MHTPLQILARLKRMLLVALLAVAWADGRAVAQTPTKPGGSAYLCTTTLGPFEQTMGPAPLAIGGYAVAPSFSLQATSGVVTWDGTNTGTPLNIVDGSDRFLDAGIWGQFAAAANVEAGLIWNGHETLTKVSTANYYIAPGAYSTDITTMTDVHATAVGMIIAGMGPPAPGGGYYYYQLGIAPLANLYSGAIATQWFSNPAGSFNISDQTFYEGYNYFFTTPVVHSYGGWSFTGPTDVINSSWGYSDPTGTATYTVAADGFARANPQTSLVCAAGNNGTANSVVGPGSGYNCITVGATGNGSLNDFSMVASFSSIGPQDYYDPVHGLVQGVRAPVDIVAPGTSIASAYYGGTTGENQFQTSDPTNGATDYYTVGAAGTSFAAPQVAGGVALLHSASYLYGMDSTLRDARVVKAVLMNSATHLPGWNNGQATNSAGVVVTTQSLDWSQGAGMLNLNQGYDQYLSGTTGVPGGAGGAVLPLGWDYGNLTLHGTNNYPIRGVLQGGTTLNVTLDWFRDCSNPSLDSNNNLVVSNDGFANLDLQIWNSTYTKLYAESISQYNNVQLLDFTLPANGQYALRVIYANQMFGTPQAEPYGLAWSSPMATLATFTRTASRAADIIVGGSTAITASIQATGDAAAWADNLAVANLQPTASGGSVTAGLAFAGTLAPGGSGSTSGYSFTASTPGTYTISPAADSLSNATLGGAAWEDSASPGTANVIVYDHAAPSLSLAATSFRVMKNTTVALPATVLNNGVNPAPNLRAGLQVTGLGGLADSGAGLIAAGSGRTLTAPAVDTSTTGIYASSYTIGLSDDQSMSGWTSLPSLTFSVSATVLDNRVVTASPVTMAGHVGQSLSGTSILSTSGDNNHYTAVTVNGTLFNSAASTGTYTVSNSYAVSGVQTGQTVLTTMGEGLPGEAPINVGVNYSATVYQYAQPQLQKTGGGGNFSGSGATYSLDFGSIHAGLAVVPANLTVQNVALDPIYQDLLDGSFDTSSVSLPFVLSGTGSFSGVAPGAAQGGIQVGLSTTAGIGVFNESLRLLPTSDGTAAGIGTTPLAPITVNISGSVFMIGAAWATAGGGSWANTANWTGGVVPQLKYDTAVLANLPVTAGGHSSGAPMTITLDAPRTLSSLTLGNTASTGGYLIAPGNGGSLTLSADGGALLMVLAGGQTISAPIHLDSEAVINTAQYTNLALSGPVDGAQGILKIGPGTLVLSSSGNSYSGGTTICAGTLTVPAGATLGAASGPLALATLNTSPAAPVLNLNSAQTVGGLSGAFSLPELGSDTATINLIGKGTILTVNQAVSGGYAGILTGSGGLVKTGAGLLALCGSDTYSGGTTLLAGTLAIDNPAALGTGALVIGGGALDNTSAGPVSLSPAKPEKWQADFTFVGTQDLNLGAAAITLAGPGSARQVAVAGSTLTVGGAIGGPYGLVKTGDGSLILGGKNSYSGGTTITGGTLTVAAGANLGAASGPLVLSNLNTAAGTAVVLNLNSAQTVAGLSGTIATPQGGLSQFSFDENGTVPLGSQNGANSAVINLNTRGTVLTVNQRTSGSYAGVLAGSGGLVKAGTGSLALLGSDTYSGGTTLSAGTLAIDNASALGSGALVISGGALDDTGPAPVALSTGNPQTWKGDFSFTGTQDLDLGTGAVTLSGNRRVTVGNGTLAVEGNLSARSGGGLIKAGSGTLLLGGASDSLASGSTVQVDAGRLVVAGWLGSPAVSVAGGVLENDGAIGGATTIGAGGFVQGTGMFGRISLLSGGSFSPGNGVGTVASGAASWARGGRFLLDLSNAAGTPGSGWDLWDITGQLSLTGGGNAPYAIVLDSLSGLTPGAAENFDSHDAYQWQIASAAGGITGFQPGKFTVDASSFANSLGGGQFQVSASGDALYLDFVPLDGAAASSAAMGAALGGESAPVLHASGTVPEPGTWALLLAGAAMLVGLVRSSAFRRRVGS